MKRFVFHLVAFSLIALTAASELDSQIVIYIQCATSIGIYLWILFTWRSSTGRMMDAYILFATSAFLFNAGQTVLYGFGAIDRLLDGRFPDTTLIETLTLVNCYLVAMHLGACIISPPRRVRPPAVVASSSDASAQTSATYVGWIFLAISLPFAVYMFRNSLSSVYAQGSFAGMYQGPEIVGADAAPMILEQFMIPGVIFLLAGARRIALNRWIALSVIAVYVLVQFFLGFRGTAIVVATGVAWVWNRTIKKLPVGLILLAVIPLSILLPLIAKTRNSTGQERLRVESFENAYAQLDNPALDLIKEMGGSMSVNADIIELVPGVRPFDAGMGYVYGASAVVPNIFWPGVHPAALNSPSRWLTEQVDPIVAEQGGSHAFTFFAEAYMNFGLIGGGIVIVLIGAALSAASRWTERINDPGRNAFFALALCFMLLYARAEFGNVTRSIVWYAAFPYLLYCMLLRQARQSTIPSASRALVRSFLPRRSAIQPQD